MLFVLWSCLPVTATAAQGGVESGPVIHVSDGDTIVVVLHGRNETVRLIGVDAPEMGHQDRPAQPLALEASKFARRMVGHKRVLLRPEPDRPDRDRYGRLLRYVLLEDGTCLNAELIKRGYGRALLRYPFSRAKEFAAFERQARADRLGIWAGKKKTPEASPEAVNLVGSRRSRKYHLPDCPWAGRIDSSNRVFFQGAGEAERLGYQPCESCRPPR